MPSLIDNLRALARHEHSDLSIADEAADEIVRLQRLVLKYERQIARARTRTNGETNPEVGGFRTDDPDTSVVAAYSINVERIKYGILTTLRDSGTPLNCSEIGDRMETPRDTVSPRFPSLRAAQLVEAVGLRPGPTNRGQTSYVLTPRGRQAVMQRAIE